MRPTLLYKEERSSVGRINLYYRNGHIHAISGIRWKNQGKRTEQKVSKYIQLVPINLHTINFSGVENKTGH